MADLFLNDPDGFERMLSASLGGMDVGAPDMNAHFGTAHGAPHTTAIQLNAAFAYDR